jgi:prepilin-type N-terminal cleavage/methylation domain-containing protein
MKITARKYSQSRREDYKGFTLVELLVVIAIIAILAAVVVLIINPLELTRRSRDAARLTDLANLQQAINVSVQEATGASATDILCEGGLTHNTDSCYGRSDTQGRQPDGTGWVVADLTTQRSVSVPTLPVDPINTDDYHYTYCSEGDNWEINTRLESEQQASKMGNDGGDEGGTGDDLATLRASGRYEVGSKLDLIQATTAGYCQYDE